MSVYDDAPPEWYIWIDWDGKICVQEYHTLQEIPVSQAEAMLNKYAALVEALRAARPYIAKMVADGVQTVLPPSLVLRKIDRILDEVDA